MPGQGSKFNMQSFCCCSMLLLFFCSWLGYNFSPQQEEHLAALVVAVGKLWFCE